MIKIIKISIFTISLLLALLLGAKFAKPIRSIAGMNTEKVKKVVLKKNGMVIPKTISNKDTLMEKPIISSQNNSEVNFEEDIDTENSQNELTEEDKMLEDNQFQNDIEIDETIQEEVELEEIIDTEEIQEIDSKDIMYEEDSLEEEVQETVDETSPLEMEDSIQEITE